MNEMLLQYMWEHRLWDSSRARTVDGLDVRIIDPGRRNTASGPDFFNAKININGRLWAGNVEVHIRASDWHRHRHDGDPAYDTVILHVVAESDCRIRRADGAEIPQLVLPYTPGFRNRYAALVENSRERPACAPSLRLERPIIVSGWLSALGTERIYAKSERVKEWNTAYEADWAATAYIALARGLGFGTNADAFELLARLTPLRDLLRHSDDPDLLCAALYGQAGFLDRLDDDTDEYRSLLRAHYDFLTAKYGWNTALRPAWKSSGMRPANFPHRRIAVLVAMLTGGFALGRMVGHIRTLDQARAIFDVRLPAYWTRHYAFGRASAAVRAPLSRESVDNLIINVIVPLSHAFGEAYGDRRATDAAADMLAALPAEANFITRDFAAAGVPCPDAFTSQAMIQLYRQYCAARKCIYCRLGRRFLACR